MAGPRRAATGGDGRRRAATGLKNSVKSAKERGKRQS
jgi:hypothetical protein